MGKRQLDIRDVIRNLAKIKEIKSIADVVVEIGGKDVDIKESDFKFNEWTLFKLIAHLLYVPLYTSIIKNYFKEYYYIDLFAGSGMGYLVRGNGRVRIAGSALIALSFAKPQFTRVYLNDKDQGRIELLKKRIYALAKIPREKREMYGFPLDKINIQNIKFSSQDANIVIEKLMKNIEERYEELYKSTGKGCHIYAFIDPEGLEFEFKSLTRILSSTVRSDLMILFNSYGASLQVYNHINHGYSDEAVRKHLGEGYYNYIEEQAKRGGKTVRQLTVDELDDILTEYYAKVIKEHGYETVTIKLSLIGRVKSPRQEREFNLIYATRKTRRGNPYIAALNYIKEVVESPARYTGYRDFIDLAIEYMETGKLPGLLSAIIDSPEEDLRKYSTSAKFGGPVI